jgi:hypothetical protein
MATIVNDRDVLLQAAGTRLLPVQLPSNYDYLGTLSGQSQTNYRNNQISLSSLGELQNAGGGQLTTLNNVGGNFLGNWESVGRSAHRNDLLSLSSSGTFIDNGTPRGSITNLDYGNVGGTKPPTNATANFFSTSGSNPSGGSDGDAHWNSSTSTMWFKTGGVWRVGGTVNANQITVGTLAAARIASNSITADKISVSSLSGISSNIGTVTSGAIQSSATIDISGFARFNGASGGYSILANNNVGSQGGISAHSGTSSLAAIRGENHSGGVSIDAVHNGGGTALRCTAISGTALEVNGDISISTQTISNLTSGSTNNVAGSNVSGTVASANNAANATNSSNTSAMNGISSSGWCRFMVTDSGTATASSTGFVYQSTVTGVRTRATGGRNFIVEEFSDEELKFNEEPESLGLDFILGLQPVTYERQDVPGITYHGIGARKTRQHLENLNKNKPNDTLGRTLDDGTESSSTIGLIAPIVKAIQELEARVKFVEDKTKA